MNVDTLRKMPKSAIQQIAETIAREIGMKVENQFVKGDFIEFVGKLKKDGKEKTFVLVFHTGDNLPDEFFTAFRKAIKKENTEALVLTTSNVSIEMSDENLQIFSGRALEEFLESKGIGDRAEKPEIPNFDQIPSKKQEITVEKSESQSALPSAGTLEKYMKAGVKFFERKEYEKALQCFDEVLLLKPGYDRAISLKAKTYAAMGKEELALEIYRKALDMMPDKYELWYELADLLHQMEKFDEELECYTKILANNKKLDKVWNNMGIVYFIKKRYDDAMFCFDRANKLKPNTPEYLNNLATAQKKLGKFDEALSCYKKVLEISPDYAEVLLNMGILYNDMEKHEEAYRTLKKYLSKEKDSVKGWHLAGIAAMNAGAYSQAIKCFEEALKIKSDLKESREGLKEAKRKFSQKGDKQKISEVEEIKMIGGGISQTEKSQEITQSSEGSAKIFEKLGTLKESEEINDEKRKGIEKEVIVEKIEERKEKISEAMEKEIEPKVGQVEKKDTVAKSGLAALVSAIAKESEGSREPAIEPTQNLSDLWDLVKNGEFDGVVRELETRDMKKKNSAALLAGFAHTGIDSFKTAYECFEAVLAQQKMHLPALFGKEFTAFAMRDYDTALKGIEFLAMKFPKNHSIALKKCLVLYAKKQFDDCEIELKKIAKDMQHSEIYWFILGCVNQQKGQRENAIKCFENTLKIKPDFAAARKMIEEIGK